MGMLRISNFSGNPYMSQAGKNVRLLALRRRTKAIALGGAAGLLIALPFAVTSLVRSLPSLAAVTLPMWTYIACFVLALFTLLQAQYWWKRANQADQGAAAEEDIAKVLASLENLGWQIEYGVRDRRVGDVDVFLLSPKGQAYTIDVKSHRGRVQFDGQQLYRQYGQVRKPFEKDFLKQAKHQAVVMKQRKKSKFVTPIVVFSSATIQGISNPVEGVYVIGKEKLLSCLQSLG
jgi:hypothetical protein